MHVLGGRFALDPPGRVPRRDEPSGCCSVQVAVEPLGKVLFESGLLKNNLQFLIIMNIFIKGKLMYRRFNSAMTSKTQ
jgi:hypothetical protein